MSTPRKKNENVGIKHNSTVKSKKIRISVLVSDDNNNNNNIKNNNNNNNINNNNIIINSSNNNTPKQSQSSRKKSQNNSITLIKSLFPSLKNENEFLNWTMEEFLDRLIKEKSEMFQEFLNEIIKVNDDDEDGDEDVVTMMI